MLLVAHPSQHVFLTLFTLQALGDRLVPLDMMERAVAPLQAHSHAIEALGKAMK